MGGNLLAVRRRSGDDGRAGDDACHVSPMLQTGGQEGRSGSGPWGLPRVAPVLQAGGALEVRRVHGQNVRKPAGTAFPREGRIQLHLRHLPPDVKCRIQIKQADKDPRKWLRVLMQVGEDKWRCLLCADDFASYNSLYNHIQNKGTCGVIREWKETHPRAGGPRWGPGGAALCLASADIGPRAPISSPMGGARVLLGNRIRPWWVYGLVGAAPIREPGSLPGAAPTGQYTPQGPHGLNPIWNFPSGLWRRPWGWRCQELR